MVATVLNRALELEPDRLVRGSMYSSDVSSLSSSSALVVEVWHFITITKRIKDMFLKARGKAMFFKVKMIVEWMIGLLIAAMLSIQYSGQCAHVLICSSCPLSWRDFRFHDDDLFQLKSGYISRLLYFLQLSMDIFPTGADGMFCQVTARGHTRMAWRAFRFHWSTSTLKEWLPGYNKAVGILSVCSQVPCHVRVKLQQLLKSRFTSIGVVTACRPRPPVPLQPSGFPCTW